MQNTMTFKEPQAMLANKLRQLGEMTVVVADTGDIEQIKEFKPVDATTNPSLLLKVAADKRYGYLLDQSISQSEGSTVDAADYFAVNVGLEILGHIEGRVSTEVDARLSFDTEATLVKARQLVKFYGDHGIRPDRILIKIAATWEGIKAAEQLEREGICCNLTLLFSFAQAVACAQSGVTLISPFVGRILDWHKAAGAEEYTPQSDPGVMSVATIYAYYKTYGYKTIVMGASFRNVGQIEALAGCDYLTVSPNLLQELSRDSGELVKRLSPDLRSDIPLVDKIDQGQFRWALNEDEMATSKLAEGIRGFARDQRKLERIISHRIACVA